MSTTETVKAGSVCAVAFSTLLCAASCSVDYAAILGGKECDQAGACASDFVCDKSSWRCVKADEYRPGTVPDDGGAADGSGPVVVYDTGEFDAGALPDITGAEPETGDSGTPDDIGSFDAADFDTGVEDAGDIDAGTLDCTPGKKRCASESALEICKTDGSGWEPRETCPAYCLVNKCVNCQPGAKWCDGNGDVALCGQDGMKIDVTDCQFGCNPGTVACMVCEPGVGWCNGNVAETCAGDGMNTTTVDCCVPGTCANGTCPDGSPYVSDAAPLSGDEWSEVTITINGCNFNPDVQVQWFVGWWDQVPNGSYVSRAPNQIQYQLKPIYGPKGKDYKFRVHNPGGGDSAEMTFHVNN